MRTNAGEERVASLVEGLVKKMYHSRGLSLLARR